MYRIFRPKKMPVAMDEDVFAELQMLVGKTMQAVSSDPKVDRHLVELLVVQLRQDYLEQLMVYITSRDNKIFSQGVKVGREFKDD